MYVWSKRLVISLLSLFVVIAVVLIPKSQPGEDINLQIYATQWVFLNYVGLVIWIFVWMIDLEVVELNLTVR